MMGITVVCLVSWVAKMDSDTPNSVTIHLSTHQHVRVKRRKNKSKISNIRVKSIVFGVTELTGDSLNDI